MKILVVDDIEPNVYQLQVLLGASGYTVETAANGAVALEKARQSPPALIITDILMPVMDGFSLCHEWLLDERLRSIPLIFYTATYTDERDRQFALELGAARFIVKPEDPDQLLQTIQAVLAEPAPGRPVAGARPPPEAEYLQRYSETLIRKLEDKMQELEQANRALEADIAARRRAEETLRQEQELLNNLMFAIPDHIYFKDRQSRFVRINEAQSRRYGLGSPADAVGKTDADIFSAEHAGQALADEQRIMETGEPMIGIEEKETWPDGRVTWVSSTKVPLRGADGKVTGLVGISRDITVQKQLQDQILRAQRMEAIGSLSGGIAHDLNNILSPIMMATGMLQTRIPDPRDQETLAMIENAVRRGASIIRQLLTFSRGVQGERAPVQVRHLISEMIGIAIETFPRNLTLVDHTARDLRPVLADATQIHQVLMNLCVNARDAMPQGGTLTVSARNLDLHPGDRLPAPEAKPGSYVLIAVRDTGEGIPPAIIGRIFEPFFTTKELGKGTGLGLSTVLGIVRSHGGFVTVDSKPGAGTTFEVYLPAAERAAPVDRGAAATAAAGHGETVLAVDDEPAILDTLRRALERHGYRVLAARDGREALEVFGRNRETVRLVLTDLMMPVMGGIELAREIRALGAAVPVIVSSGLNDAKDPNVSSEGLLAELLPKPYDLETLFVAVRRQLDLRRS